MAPMMQCYQAIYEKSREFTFTLRIYVAVHWRKYNIHREFYSALEDLNRNTWNCIIGTVVVAKYV